MQKKSKPAQPANQAVVQQAENLPDYLEAYRSIFIKVKQYLGGDKSVLEALKVEVAKTREVKTDRDNLNRAFGKLVLRGMPISLITDVYDEKSGRWLSSRVNDLMACAKAVGVTVNNLSWEEAKHVFDLYLEQSQASTAGNDVFAILSSHGATPFPALEAWVNPRPRHSKNQAREVLGVEKMKLELEAKIASLEAEMNEAAGNSDFETAAAKKAEIANLRQEMTKLESGSTSADDADAMSTDAEEEVPTIEAKIASLEAEMNEAAGNSDFKTAAAKKAEIASLRATATPTPTATSTPSELAPNDKGANGKSGLTLSQAVKMCQAAGAKNSLKKAYARFEKDDNFTDIEFVQTVADLTGNSVSA